VGNRAAHLDRPRFAVPGLCSLIFSVAIVADSGSIGSDPGIVSLLIFCFLVGAGGVALIIHAIRR
jgi:hypothetical protein